LRKRAIHPAASYEFCRQYCYSCALHGIKPAVLTAQRIARCFGVTPSRLWVISRVRSTGRSCDVDPKCRGKGPGARTERTAASESFNGDELLHRVSEPDQSALSTALIKIGAGRMSGVWQNTLHRRKQPGVRSFTRRQTCVIASVGRIVVKLPAGVS
jgi:hypothetical protein